MIYGYGTGVAAARLAAQRHFPSDVVAGGVIGWFVGDYVYAKRHNPELMGKPSATSGTSSATVVELLIELPRMDVVAST